MLSKQFIVHNDFFTFTTSTTTTTIAAAAAAAAFEENTLSIPLLYISMTMIK